MKLLLVVSSVAIGPPQFKCLKCLRLASAIALVPVLQATIAGRRPGNKAMHEVNLVQYRVGRGVEPCFF